MPCYTTLFFDLDNTLLDFTSAERTALVKSFSFFGIALSREEIARYSAINDGCWKLLEQGQITREELLVRRFRLFCGECGRSADPAAVNRRYMQELASLPETMPGAADLCRRLSGKYALWALTNATESIARSRFAASGLAPWFRGLFISEALGAAKPDPRFFDEVIARIPEKDRRAMLMVGDSPSSDMRGGADSGIDTCFFSPDGRPCPLPVTYSVRSYADLAALLL